MSRELPATESVDPRYQDLDAWEPSVALNALWEAQMSAAAAVQAALPAIERAALAAADRLAPGGRLAYAGAGTSGRISAQDGAELPPTFDWPRDRLVTLMAGGIRAFTDAVEGAEDDREAALRAVTDHRLGPNDVVLGVAASGATPFTCACLEAAGALGCLTIAVANSPGSALLSLASISDPGGDGCRTASWLDAAESRHVTEDRAESVLDVADVAARSGASRPDGRYARQATKSCDCVRSGCCANSPARVRPRHKRPLPRRTATSSLRYCSRAGWTPLRRARCWSNTRAACARPWPNSQARSSRPPGELAGCARACRSHGTPRWQSPARRPPSAARPFPSRPSDWRRVRRSER